MWWRGQNLEGPLHGPDGTAWHFSVWHDHVDGTYTQRVFFWDELREQSGVVELAGPSVLHVRRIRDLEKRIARDTEYRARWLRRLDFPLERHWS